MAKTPTEVLMETMEDFSRSEPLHVVIVYLNEADEIDVRTNHMDYIMLAGIGSYLQAYANRKIQEP